MRIAVVEDNHSLRKGIAYRLTDDGHAVDALADGILADAFLRRESCDLIILDINLPGRSGLEILQDLRKRNDPRPVILLTARASTEERVAGLDAGADDYLVKPFAMDELAARVRALGRRKVAPPRRSMALGDALHLDLEAPQLLDDGVALDVPRRELGLLIALAEAEGRPLNKTQLLDQIYGAGSETDEKVVEVYVSRLRKRLARYNLAITVKRGIGYALETVR